MGTAELHGNSQKNYLLSLHFSAPIIPSNAQFKELVLSAAVTSIVAT